MPKYPTNGSKLENTPGKDMSTSIPRYANLEEFRSEFGSYRVNRNAENLCDGKYSIKDGMVKNDPYTNQEKGTY